jgi:hypothetical protein
MEACWSQEWISKQNIQARIMIIEEYGFSMCDSMFSTSKPNLVYSFTSSSHLEGLMCFSHTPKWTKSLLSSPQALSCGCVICENQLSRVERLRCCEHERAIQIHSTFGFYQSFMHHLLLLKVKPPRQLGVPWWALVLVVSHEKFVNASILPPQGKRST